MSHCKTMSCIEHGLPLCMRSITVSTNNLRCVVFSINMPPPGPCFLHQCHNAAMQGYEVSRHRAEYQHYCKFTGVAAEKISNSWWTACTVETEGCIWVAELQLSQEILSLRSLDYFEIASPSPTFPP